MIEPRDSGGWKVKIDRPIFADRLHFFLIRYVPGFVEVMQPDGMIKRLKEGESSDGVKPTFILYGLDSKSMMIALAEALETEGAKTPNDFKVQGLLEATRFHLSDLRRLLKLDKGIDAGGKS